MNNNLIRVLRPLPQVIPYHTFLRESEWYASDDCVPLFVVLVPEYAVGRNIRPQEFRLAFICIANILADLPRLCSYIEKISLCDPFTRLDNKELIVPSPGNQFLQQQIAARYIVQLGVDAVSIRLNCLHKIRIIAIVDPRVYNIHIPVIFKIHIKDTLPHLCSMFLYQALINPANRKALGFATENVHMPHLFGTWVDHFSGGHDQ